MERNPIIIFFLFAAAFIFSCSSAASYNSVAKSSSSETLTIDDTFTDERDSKTYRWVKIMGQFWMAENLNYNANGSVCYDSLQSNCDKYGRLYGWAAAMALEPKYDTALYGTSCEDYCYGIDLTQIEGGLCPLDCYEPGAAPHRGICPPGWHLPSDAEWSDLVSFVDFQRKDHVNNDAGIKLKSMSGWDDYEGKSGNGADQYGFSALPGGRGAGNSYLESGTSGSWWGVTERDSVSAMNRRMVNSRGSAYRYFNEKNSRLSVRCVKD